MRDEVCSGENVSGEGSPDVDCDGNIPELLESVHARELCDVKNDGCPKSMNVLDLPGGHAMEESCGLHLGYGLPNLSVSQKYPDLTFIGDHEFSKNVDAHDISEADCHEHLSVIDVNLAKNLSGSGKLFDLPYTNNDGLSYNVIGQPAQYPELLCSQNDYLSQHPGTHDCSAVDNGKGSSAMDLTNAAQTFSVSTKLSELSAGNYDSSDTRGQHLSRNESLATTGAISIQDQSELNQNGRTDPVDFVNDPTTSTDAINPSPRRWSFRKTLSRQNAETVKCKRNGRHAGKVSLNLDLCQIPRKRRGCFGKRARTSSWGSLSNLELNFVKNSVYCTNLTEYERPSRSRGKASGKQVKNRSKVHSGKARRKTSRRTGGVSVKSKFGVGVGPKSMMDVNNEEPFQITGKTLGLFNDEELTKSMVSQGLKAHRKRMGHLSDDTRDGAGKSFAENIPNSGSDLGTSPDSEVINLNVDTCWGNSEEEFHNVPGSSQVCVASDGDTHLVPENSKEEHKQVSMSVFSAGDKPMESGLIDNDRQSAEHGEIAVDVPYSINVSASSSSDFVPENTFSTERQSKEQTSTAADIESPCVHSAVGTEVTPTVGFDLQSPVLQVSAKLHPSKGQKILNGGKKDEVRNTGSDIQVAPNKGRRKSKKKVNQDKLASKHKLKVKLKINLASFEAERQAEAGNSKLDGVGEPKTAKSSLVGDVSTLNVVPRGSIEQSKKPRNAWVLCDACQKWRRIPATLADHIEEANCSWTCEDNVDKNFGNCLIPQEKSDAEINTELEISDASCDEGVWDARLDCNDLGENQSTVTQQSTWKLIKSNQFLHRRQQTQTIDEIMVCHCKPPSDGQMGCGDGCLNRMLNIECVQGTCPCGELCSNQQFQNRNYARLKMFKCGKKGYGLQVLDNISEGQFLIEYIGEVLDMHSYEARQREYAMQGHKHFYFMTLNGSEVIDACAKGNLGRFINHSCDPNCSTEKWMVNGEVCIGLFALKNIKKGEELTFDYNYVRVFGAAAKKCVCGSSQCRGYIGGQSQDSEIVVQDDSEDEYPEPVMVCEDGLVDESYPDLISPLSTFDGVGDTEKAVDVMKSLDFDTSLQAVETGISKKVLNNELRSVVEHEDTIKESVHPLNTYESTDLKEDTSENSEDPCETSVRAKVILKPDDTSSETPMTIEPENFEAKENMKQSCCVTPEENSGSLVLNQLVSDVIDNKRKPKSGLGKGSIKSPATKASRLASSIKREKFKSNPVNVQRPQGRQSKDDQISCKPKKEFEVSSTGRFEAVQEKLNELLNPDGGISKRKDASRGYLKLLVLTAASGDSCNGEAIQSNRYLSMILGALLETKSQTVLVDIIEKNGLQMLHNMLKRSRKEFNKIPILRKLLKVFEYLATRKILTSEHISVGPTCPGVESFRESILSLTEHIDKQVHQIARNFRDRWIPRPTRRHQREECRVDVRSSSEYCRYSDQKQNNQVEKYLETPDHVTKSGVTPTTLNAGIVDGSCQSSGSGMNTRKRKSRWDHSEDLNRIDNHMRDDGTYNIDDDLPPGFAAPCNTTVVSSEVCSYFSQGSTNLNHTCEVVSGQPQLRFISCLPVSYGVPLGLVKQVGMPQTATFEGLSVAPGMPFHPFPPLPPYPHSTCNSAPNAFDSAVMGLPAHDQNMPVTHKLGANSPISRGASIRASEMPSTENKLNFRQSRVANTSGRKYFKSQRWNSSKLGPPWIRNRNNWGFTGNNLRNGMNSVGLEIPGEKFRDWHGRERDMYHQPH